MNSIKLATAAAPRNCRVVCPARPCRWKSQRHMLRRQQVCDLMKGLFEKQTDISVNMVRLSAGETYYEDPRQKR